MSIKKPSLSEFQSGFALDHDDGQRMAGRLFDRKNELITNWRRIVGKTRTLETYTVWTNDEKNNFDSSRFAGNEKQCALWRRPPRRHFFDDFRHGKTVSQRENPAFEFHLFCMFLGAFVVAYSFQRDAYRCRIYPNDFRSLFLRLCFKTKCQNCLRAAMPKRNLSY